MFFVRTFAWKRVELVSTKETEDKTNVITWVNFFLHNLYQGSEGKQRKRERPRGTRLHSSFHETMCQLPRKGHQSTHTQQTDRWFINQVSFSFWAKSLCVNWPFVVFLPPTRFSSDKSLIPSFQRTHCLSVRVKLWWFMIVVHISLMIASERSERYIQEDAKKERDRPGDRGPVLSRLHVSQSSFLYTFGNFLCLYPRFLLPLPQSSLFLTNDSNKFSDIHFSVQSLVM